MALSIVLMCSPSVRIQGEGRWLPWCMHMQSAHQLNGRTEGREEFRRKRLRGSMPAASLCRYPTASGGEAQCIVVIVVQK